jgi:GNAT superfamily N-acetyltransferase
MSPSSPSAVVRPLQPADAGPAARLCVQLGYNATETEMRERIQSLAGAEGRLLLAADLAGQLVGWVDAATERHLHTAPYVIIGGLVVDETCRGQGLGRLLCAHVERWAQAQSIAGVRVRSQAKRLEAHRFYLNQGYGQIKTSFIFEKLL